MAKVAQDSGVVIVGPWGAHDAETERLERERTSAVRSLRGALVPTALSAVFWWQLLKYITGMT